MGRKSKSAMPLVAIQLMAVPFVLAYGVFLFLFRAVRWCFRRGKVFSRPRRAAATGGKIVEAPRPRIPAPASFAVGCEYFDAAKNRVFVCIARGGQKSPRVAFACLDSVAAELELLRGPERQGWCRITMAGEVETAQYGALRADTPATPGEIEHERDFLRRLRKQIPKPV